MSVLELPRVVAAEVLPDEDITHYYCCDENRANCGLDISGEPEVVGTPNRECKACVEQIGEPCGFPLCPNLDAVWSS